MRKFLCFIGFHDPQIIRSVLFGNVCRAELKCVCGDRFEWFCAGPITRFYPVTAPSEFWVAYDAGEIVGDQ